MASQMSRPAWLILISLTCALLISCIRASLGDQKVYIVYMGDRPKGDFSASSHHTSMLHPVVGSRASESLLYSYKRSFNGFVAKLTEEEMEKIASMEGVVSVFPNEEMELHTTRSWDFMGFPQEVPRRHVESDIIIGVIDTGIWPESDSFDDTGFGPPPKKWKGSCQSSRNFTCNNKIIGARYYHSHGQIAEKDFHSARDLDGHGTHTASTAAGNLVSGATLLGLGLGTARGGVPSARIAVYKTSWSDGIREADILAAFDDAIADGVDIISISIGSRGKTPKDYFRDAIAIGAFHAMKKGILTSNSAGNSGPAPQTIRNFSPWSLTVAAATIDRKFVTKVQLGNNKCYEGVSLNTFELKDHHPLVYGGEAPNTRDGFDGSESRYTKSTAGTIDSKIVTKVQLSKNMFYLEGGYSLEHNHQYPLVYGGDVPNTQAGFNGSISRYCSVKNSLNPSLVKGKIVLCDRRTKGTVAFSAGAIGTIMADRRFKDSAKSYPLPASHLGKKDGRDILRYINSIGEPTATILRSIETIDKFAPFVYSSSSRGPNPITRDILKPDLSAPGVDIVAAWSQGTSVTKIKKDKRIVPYNIISGTSMACPHVTAAAAYVKSFHPGWSPAAIKSALMTTARPMSVHTNRDAEFAYGAGHIDPVIATKPGLVYDAGELDYVKFLCGQGYSTKHLQNVTGDNISCSEANNGTDWDLNYPSFALSAQSEKPITRIFHRTVTNVGSRVSIYKATIEKHAGLEIHVEPNVLTFHSLDQKLSFAVTVRATIKNIHNNVLSGSLVWDDGVYQVRSPIVAHFSS